MLESLRAIISEYGSPWGAPTEDTPRDKIWCLATGDVASAEGTADCLRLRDVGAKCVEATWERMTAFYMFTQDDSSASQPEQPESIWASISRHGLKDASVADRTKPKSKSGNLTQFSFDTLHNVLVRREHLGEVLSISRLLEFPLLEAPPCTAHQNGVPRDEKPHDGTFNVLASTHAIANPSRLAAQRAGIASRDMAVFVDGTDLVLDSADSFGRRRNTVGELIDRVVDAAMEFAPTSNLAAGSCTSSQGQSPTSQLTL